MTISDLLSEDLVVPRIRAARPDEVIQELGAHLADHHPGIRRQDVVRVLLERERLGSTAVGEGLAIPHAKLDSAGRLVACLGRSRKGIDFGSPDGEPTHFFFVLIAPESAQGDHLKALAHISRLFKDQAFRARLMAARTGGEMYEVIASEDAR